MEIAAFPLLDLSETRAAQDWHVICEGKAMIPSAFHRAADLLFILAMIIAPCFFWYPLNGVVAWSLITTGLILGFFWLMTDWKNAEASGLTIRNHLRIDAISGVVLLVAPWICDFHHQAWIPHGVAGALLILFAVLTDRHGQEAKLPVKGDPGSEGTRARSPATGQAD